MLTYKSYLRHTQISKMLSMPNNNNTCTSVSIVTDEKIIIIV